MLRDTFQTGVEDLRSGGTSTIDSAKQLLRLRKELEEEEEAVTARRMDLARRYAEDAERVVVPSDEFAGWFRSSSDGAADDV